MRRFFFFFCFFVVLAAQTNAQAVRMEHRLTGLQTGMAKLIGMYGDQNFLADSVLITTPGQFTYKRDTALEAGYYTWLLPGQKNFSILIDTDQQFVMTGDLADLNSSTRFDASINNTLLYQTNALQIEVETKHRALGEAMKQLPLGSPEVQRLAGQQAQLLQDRKTRLEALYKANPTAFFTKFKAAGQNPDPRDFPLPNGTQDTLARLIDYRSRFFDNVDMADTRLLRTPVIANKLRRYIKDLTPQHPDSLIVVTDAIIKKSLPYPKYFEFFVNWIGLAHENTKTNVMDGEAVYVHIIKNYITHEKATWLERKDVDALHKKAGEMEASLMGRKGPDVIALDMNGKLQSIYEKKSQLVVVFMFSPDCEHCKEQAPEIKRIYEAYKDKGVDFYGIAVNTTDGEWRKFMDEQKFPFTNVFDPTNRAIYAKYFVDITPELYLLDQNRTIVAKNLQANQLEAMFKKYLK